MKALSNLLAGLTLSTTLALAAIGCKIYDREPCGSSADPRTDDLCGSMCGRLIECGAIPVDAADECQSTCRDRSDAEPTRTAAGARCVLEDACRPLRGYDCPGAPLPSSGSGASSGGGAGGAGGAPSSSTSTGTGSTGAGGAPRCSDNHDCAANEDCIEGTCLTRCNASCECEKDERCTDGYCRSDAPPPPACRVSCDCPKGMSCVDGACR